jgi:hypothetical protein
VVELGSDRVKHNFLCILFRSGRAFRVLGQKIGPCPGQFLLQVDNFGRSPAHILSGLVWVGVFSGGLGQVRRVSRPVIRYSSKGIRTRHTLFSFFKSNIPSWSSLSSIPISPTPVFLCISYSIPTTLYFIQPSPTTISSLLIFSFSFLFFSYLPHSPFGPLPLPDSPSSPSLCAPPPWQLASLVELAAPAPALQRRSSVCTGGRPGLPRRACARAGRRVAVVAAGQRRAAAPGQRGRPPTAEIQRLAFPVELAAPAPAPGGGAPCMRAAAHPCLASSPRVADVRSLRWIWHEPVRYGSIPRNGRRSSGFFHYPVLEGGIADGIPYPVQTA